MNVVQLPPHEVKIGPRLGGRQADPKKVEEIAQSFLVYGQFHPLLLDRDNTLIAGLHRLEAAKANGMALVDCVYRDETDELFLKEMELEENLRRMELGWKEKSRALAELHEIRVARDPNWSQSMTAAMTEKNQREVSEAIKVNKMIDLFPEIAEAKTFRHAVNMAAAKAKQVLRHQEVKDNLPDYSNIAEKIVLGDSVEIIKTLPSEYFHAIITDPPFGIDYDERTAGTVNSTLNSYKDDEQAYERILTMAPDMYRVLKPNGWLVWFLGISWYERCKNVFRDAGFVVDEMPIIWDRSDGKCFTNRPDRWFARAYDVALHALKGNPMLALQGKPNVIRVPPVSQAERELQVERPVELYAELIKRLTIPNQRIADFFVGSGSCPAAAASLGRDYFGCELNPERRAKALTKIKSHTRTEAA